LLEHSEEIAHLAGREDAFGSLRVMLVSNDLNEAVPAQSVQVIGRLMM
jgi:hypothetical protein